MAAKAKPAVKRLLRVVGLTPDTRLAHGGELLLRNGLPGGEVTSEAYGNSVKAIVALGFVATAGAGPELLDATFELDIAGDRVPVRASLKAPYDPAGTKVKG